MKHPRSLLPLIVLVASLAGFLPARADDDASHKAAADELLQAMHSERIIDRAVDQMSQGADRMMPPGRSSATPAEEAAFRESLRQQARDIIKGQLDWQTLEPTFAQLYVGDFSEAELKQLIEFYKTPLGEKLLDKQSDLNAKIVQITQQKARTAVPILTQKLRASVAKFREDHPVKPVSPAPEASPAAPAPAGSPVSAPVMPPPAATATPAATPVATPVPPPALK